VLKALMPKAVEAAHPKLPVVVIYTISPYLCSSMPETTYQNTRLWQAQPVWTLGCRYGQITSDQ
jgi:hypothetical protein